MRNDFGYAVAAAFAALGLLIAAPQPAHAAGKIVCWKDATGRTVGCGDTVPPEYRGAATKELDTRGVTRKTTESAEDRAKRREQEEAAAREKAEEEKRAAEQRRQDKALIATFSSADEIDAKRDRDLQTLDHQIKQQQNLLQVATKRHRELLARKDLMEKSKKPVNPMLSEDIDRALEDKTDLEQSIAAKEREKTALRRKYGEMRDRYVELRGSPRK